MVSKFHLWIFMSGVVCLSGLIIPNLSPTTRSAYTTASPITGSTTAPLAFTATEYCITSQRLRRNPGNLYEDPTNCQKYYVCDPNTNQGTQMPCPAGTLWSQKAGTCVHCYMADCRFDSSITYLGRYLQVPPCPTASTPSHRTTTTATTVSQVNPCASDFFEDVSSCRGFYRCPPGGYCYRMCCPRGQCFRGNSCHLDHNCLDDCQISGAIRCQDVPTQGPSKTTTETTTPTTTAITTSDRQSYCYMVKDCLPLVVSYPLTIDTTATSFNTKVTYSCPVGSNILGIRIRICQADGTWSEKEPTCESINCPPLIALHPLITIDTTDRIVNTVVTYTCFTGYTVIGDRQRTCQADGTWSGTDPSCEVPFNATFEFANATFTNLGAIGRFGPTEIGSHYDGKDHERLVTVKNGIQIFTVPETGKYIIEVAGASGGRTREKYTQYYGRGAVMKGAFNLNQGDKLKILVGQMGTNCTVKYPDQGSSGGGGGSFVTKLDNTPLIIAGGGGGVERLDSDQHVCHGSASTSGNSGYGGGAWPGGRDGQGASTADRQASGGGGGKECIS